MTDNNKHVKTHELYTKFCQWMGVSNIAENTYSMINYSLHTAELYLKTQYGIPTSITTVTSQVADSSNFQFPIYPTKVLDMFKDGNVCYPTISYLDTSNFSLAEEIGCYKSDLSDVNLPGTYFSTFLVGYVQKVSLQELNTPNEEYKLNIPTFEINNVPVVSPITVYTSEFDLTVIGDKGSKVFVDNLEVGVLEDSGKLDIPITLTQEVSDIAVNLTAADGSRDSNTVPLVFILSSEIPTPDFHVLGYTTRVNSKTTQVTVVKPSMSNLTFGIDGELTQLGDETNEQTILTFDIPFETDKDSTKVIIELFVTKDTKKSKSRFILIDYNSALNTDYLKELNKDAATVPYLPEDLMVGMFKLAKHFYTGTLYNNTNVDKYRTSMGESTSYISHTIPADVKSLLAGYITYK